MLPDKKSNRWLIVFIAYVGVVFTGLITTRLILGSAIDSKVLFGFLILSLGSAVLPVIAGYIGKGLFFKIYTSSNVIALAYMFVLVQSDRGTGWADLTSIAVYIYLLPIGAVLGLIAELIAYFKQKKS